MVRRVLGNTCLHRLSPAYLQLLPSGAHTASPVNDGTLGERQCDYLVAYCICPVLQITTEESVGSQLAYLATASQARDNGRYVDHEGNTMDW